MLSVADRQQGFFDAAWCAALLPEDSVYALLAEHGDRIVRDEDFAGCYSERHGRLDFPRFGGHLKTCLCGRVGRMFSHAEDLAVFEGVQARGRSLLRSSGRTAPQLARELGARRSR